MKAVKTLLTVLLCMAMVALSGGILGTLLLFGSGQTGSVSTVETDLGARYGNAIHNQLADILDLAMATFSSMALVMPMELMG